VTLFDLGIITRWFNSEKSPSSEIRFVACKPVTSVTNILICRPKFFKGKIVRRSLSELFNCVTEFGELDVLRVLMAFNLLTPVNKLA